MALLSTENLSIGYGKKVLAEKIVLELNRGDLVGLIGQNGVGKSTLLRTLAGLLTKCSGEVYLDKKPIKSTKRAAKAISIVLTGKPDTLNLTVVELLALGRHPYTGWLGYLKEDDKKKMEEALSLMEINYIANTKLSELSDGQLQKAMIARALAQDTAIIILDEPTSHLDLKNKIDVLELLKKIANQGKSVLISTHEVGLAGKYCNRFWCMDFGKEMLTGEPQELITKGKVQHYLHIEKDLL